jgi:hypothetical protein
MRALQTKATCSKVSNKRGMAGRRIDSELECYEADELFMFWSHTRASHGKMRLITSPNERYCDPRNSSGFIKTNEYRVKMPLSTPRHTMAVSSLAVRTYPVVSLSASTAPPNAIAAPLLR